MEYKPSVGLALSGGGHKGIAHAGVLQFLSEQKIEIDIISGTSAGAIVGGLYTFGKKPEDILAFFKSVDLFSWNHISFRKPGILDAEKFINYLDDIFKDTQLKDLPKEFYISATDMESGRLKIFNQHTKVKEAIAASSAFPGVFSPVNVQGRLYSDGGILNNFPVNTIQGRCDFLIGVNLDPIVNHRTPSSLKSIKAVAMRAMELMMAQNAAAQNELCDWFISPQGLTSYSTFETSKKRMDEIFEIGYREAQSNFEAIKPILFSQLGQ